jgi:hypothetical protein
MTLPDRFATQTTDNYVKLIDLTTPQNSVRRIRPSAVAAASCLLREDVSRMMLVQSLSMRSSDNKTYLFAPVCA